MKRRFASFAVHRVKWRKRKGIEPSKPLLAQSFIGFEDRGRHQSGTRFRPGGYTDLDRDAAAWAAERQVGSVTRPMNRMVPVTWSKMKNTKG